MNSLTCLSVFATLPFQWLFPFAWTAFPPCLLGELLFILQSLYYILCEAFYALLLESVNNFPLCSTSALCKSIILFIRFYCYNLLNGNFTYDGSCEFDL